MSEQPEYTAWHENKAETPPDIADLLAERIGELDAEIAKTIDAKSPHYGAGGIETIDIIKAKLTPEQYEGYLLGNVIKYATRANHKGDKARDIEKLVVYSNLLATL